MKRKARLQFKKLPKKKKPSAEIVTKCDLCKERLRLTCQRTLMSSVCAEGARIPVYRTPETQYYFCSNKCKDIFVYEMEHVIEG